MAGRSQVRVRVTAAGTVVALLAAVAGSAAFVILLRRSLEQSLVSSARQQAQAVVAQLQEGDSPSRAVVGTIDDVTTQILDAGGRVLAGDRARQLSPLRSTSGVSRRVRVRGLRDSYTVVARRAGGGRLVVVGKSEENLEAATKSAVELLLAAVPVGVSALAVVVWFVVGRALRPVEAMRRGAATITSEHLHNRLPVPGGEDELSMLARTLNEMLDRIDASQRLQRQFVSDASHELRSPLASMRQLTEVASRFPDSVTTQELASEVRAEEQRMEELVSALLTLARLEDESTGTRGVVDLDDVLIDELARQRQQAPQVRFEVAQLTAVQVRGQPVLLAQLVRNLVSNAARHAVATVQVSLTTTRDTAVLHIDDDGTGIAPPDRERVFERFVRLDEARARDAGGSGLGLAIVRTVVSEAGGSVTVTEAPSGGARFTVILPTA